jgi:hypothetical protein
MSLEEFESVSGLVNNIKRKFPDKLPTDFVGEIGLAKLQGQQQVIKYIEDMLLTLEHRNQ